jgi:hypothetical protein
LHAAQNLRVTAAVGQWFIGGVWVQSQTENGYEGNAPGIFFELFGAGNLLSGGFGYSGSGLASSSWDWVWFAKKVTAARTPSAGIAMFVRADSTHTIQIYAPVLIQVPAGTFSDNEAMELASHLATYDASCAAGQICGIQGQTLNMAAYSGFPTRFANLGTAANGTFLYCSDCTIANRCAGGGTGALAKRLNGIWVCN